MAYDYLDVLKQIEAAYPKAYGTASLGGITYTGDEGLRRALVGYANFTFDELEESQRWRKGFITIPVVTTPNVSTYGILPSNDWLYLHRVYWRFATGRIQPLELMDQNEPRLIFGDGPNTVSGQPRYYALLADQIQLYPTPNNAGPDSGNYTLQIEYYQRLPHLVETTASTGAVNNQLTVPSTALLTASGLDSTNAAGNYLTLRLAGNQTGISAPYANDDFTEKWTSFSGATTVIMASIPPNLISSGQCFFNSSNWLISMRPKVLLAGMGREIATYLKDTQAYTIWEARWANQLEELQEWDQQSHHDVEVLAGAVGGQLQPMLRDIDWPLSWDIRGLTS